MTQPRLAVHDLGGRGPTFVLVHGFTGSSEDFGEVAPQLTDLRRVVLLDQLGHGASPRAERYTYDVLTAAVTAALERIGGPVDLLGHSLGGRVVLPIAIARPELVRSLVLMDTWGDAPDRNELDRYDADQPDLERELIVSRGRDASDRARLGYNVAHTDPAAVEQLAPLVFVDDPRLLDRSRVVVSPVTVLIGQCDTPFLGPSRRLAAHIPGAQLVEVAGAFHSPQLTHPAEWVAAVRRHLEAVDRADA